MRRADEANNETPQLGVLEEDDEFEEFPVQDWDDSEADLSHLLSGSNTPRTAQEAFWEENWDDDDIEDDFSKQLREELHKTSSSTVDTTMTR